MHTYVHGLAHGLARIHMYGLARKSHKRAVFCLARSSACIAYFPENHHDNMDSISKHQHGRASI